MNSLRSKKFSTVLMQSSCICCDLRTTQGNRTIAEAWKGQPSAPRPVLHSLHVVHIPTFPFSRGIAFNKLCFSHFSPVMDSETKFIFHCSTACFCISQKFILQSPFGEQHGKSEILIYNAPEEALRNKFTLFLLLRMK